MRRHAYMNCCLLLIWTSVALVGCRDERAANSISEPAPNNSTNTPLPPPAAVRGGYVLSLPDNAGYVEWLFTPASRQVQVFFMDRGGNPLPDIAEPTLTLTTPTGPRHIALEACDDPVFEDACGSVVLPWLVNEEPAGLIRFLLDGKGYRILVPASPSAS